MIRNRVSGDCGLADPEYGAESLSSSRDKHCSHDASRQSSQAHVLTCLPTPLALNLRGIRRDPYKGPQGLFRGYLGATYLLLPLITPQNPKP